MVVAIRWNLWQASYILRTVGDISVTGAMIDTAEDKSAKSAVEDVAIALPANTMKETNGTRDKTLHIKSK
jgi:hypothetical protein